jgi:hypothetical protein
MPNKVSLYPIYALARAGEERPFDLTVLPFRIMQGVTVENISAMLAPDTFAWLQGEIGRHDLADVENVRYAIVHRYETEDRAEGSNADIQSEQLLRNIAVCLRIIRPMRQIALLMRGELQENGTLNLGHLDHPINLLELPEVQKLFHLRNADLELLRALTPYFLQGMHGEFWKFKMAVQFYEAGYFDHWFWKARYSLWCSGMEALFTSQGREHMGSLVAKARIRWFLGSDTPIYDPGDIPRYLRQPPFNVGSVINDAYTLRNAIAHGDRTPNEFFRNGRQGVSGQLNRADVMLEAVSFVLRKSLLRILQDGLLNNFADNTASIAYFSAAGLTLSQLRPQKKGLLKRLRQWLRI